MTLDSRFLVAAKEPMRARQMLNELHQKIGVTKDRSQMSELLAQYVALANRMVSPPTNIPSPYQDIQAAVSTLSRIIKKQGDDLKAILNNLK